MALFCKSCFGLFQPVSAYSLSQNTIESAETSRLFHQPNQPNGSEVFKLGRVAETAHALASEEEIPSSSRRAELRLCGPRDEPSKKLFHKQK
jgi:hypothetical protein